MKFEEVLPALKKGKKIRRRVWLGVDYIYVRDGFIVDNNGNFFEIDFSITLNDDWEIVKELEYDWDYIIENKCLCWFWDISEDAKIISSLNSIITSGEFPYMDSIDGLHWRHCRPARKDEVKFYEDEK